MIEKIVAAGVSPGSATRSKSRPVQRATPWVVPTHGVGRGDRVGLYLPNCPQFVIGYLAVLKCGAIAVSLNCFWKRDEVGFALADSGTRVVLTDAALEANIPRPLLPTLHAVLRIEDWPALLATHVEAPPAPELAADTPAVIVYSSGTTGMPKGCTLSHGNVVSNIEAKVRLLRIAPDDRLLLFVPVFHCFGQNAVLNAGLQAGATLLLERRFGVERILEVVRAESPTMFFGAPPAFTMLIERALPADLASLRYYFSAAAPLPLSVALRWHETFGQPIHEGYGLTETSPFASYNHETHFRLGSVGVPIPGVQMRVVAPDSGAELGPHEVGEITIRGPNVMLGYWGQPEETARAVRDGWFHTGDLGYRDEDGYYFLVDRLKDMINVGGLKVSPAEVEQVLRSHPGVAAAGVYALPDPVLGERVAACVVRTAPAAATPEDLVTHCRERLASYKAPVQVDFVAALPASPTGKLLRRDLRALAAGRS